MKNMFISQLLVEHPKFFSKLVCWCKNRREHGKVVFFDLVDSTGSIEAVCDKRLLSHPVAPESALQIGGKIVVENNVPKVIIASVDILAHPIKPISPRPRQDFDILHPKYVNLVQSKKHLYIRNQRFQAIMRLKDLLLISLRDFLHSHKFVEVDTPILTKDCLYNEHDAFLVDYFGETAFLSQCAGLYLQAIVQSLENVFTVTPAFRNIRSRHLRNNPEFWHIKGQSCFCDLNEMIGLLEVMTYESAERMARDGQKYLSQIGVTLRPSIYRPPLPRITHADAVAILRKTNFPASKNKGLTPKHEEQLAKIIKRPFFVTTPPRSAEPFPYAGNPNDGKTALTADLIGPGKMGEIGGVAEFELDFKKLRRRLLASEKKVQDYSWYLEIFSHGVVQHSGFGLGVERLLRCFLQLDHIRHTFTFPRLYGRPLWP